MRNISENLFFFKSKHTWSINFSPRKSCRLWDNVGKHGTARQATDNVIRCMRFARWIPKTTHTEYVITPYYGMNGYANEPQYYAYRYVDSLLSCDANWRSVTPRIALSRIPPPRSHISKMTRRTDSLLEYRGAVRSPVCNHPAWFKNIATDRLHAYKRRWLWTAKSLQRPPLLLATSINICKNVCHKKHDFVCVCLCVWEWRGRGKGGRGEVASSSKAIPVFCTQFTYKSRTRRDVKWIYNCPVVKSEINIQRHL